MKQCLAFLLIVALLAAACSGTSDSENELPAIPENAGLLQVQDLFAKSTELSDINDGSLTTPELLIDESSTSTTALTEFPHIADDEETEISTTIGEEEWPAEWPIGDVGESLTSQPEYMADDDVNEYFDKLITWILSDKSMIDTAANAATPLATVCYVTAFLTTFYDDRLQVIANDLVGVDLLFGLPLGLITNQELNAVLSNAEPCVETLFDNGSFMSELGLEMGSTNLDPDVQAEVALGMQTCFADLRQIQGFTKGLLRAALFDESKEIVPETTFLLIDVCRDSFIIPMIMESYIADSEITREDAECLAPLLVDSMLKLLRTLADNVDFSEAEAFEKETATMGFGMLGAIFECGLSLDDLIQMGATSDQHS